MKDVYIIIPVYKGLKETRACISSVLKYTQNRPILIINDASPDPDITRYVSSLKEGHPGIHVYENFSNMGFVKTANLGFDFDQQKDVIILNSDTIVTSHWVEKLQTWAYADPKAATVTPMSNSATICSYPLTCRQNPLPENMTPDILNMLFEKAGKFQADELIDIPTGIGFCLYIKRTFLEKAGYFNTDLFGTGYGEENDFCMKCAKHGGRHLAAIDTFIFHNEGVSFGPVQKKKQNENAIKVLNELYPEYNATIQRFLETDPLTIVRRKVDFLRFFEFGKKGMLFISHGKGGGIDKHILELSQLIQTRGMHPFVLTPHKSRGVTLASASASDAFLVEIDSKNWLTKLLALLKQLNICHLHFHHLMDYHEDIYKLPERAGLFYDFTLHDFYMFCRNISGYIEHKDYFCGFDIKKSCKNCPAQKDTNFYHPHKNNIDLFRKTNLWFLKNARKIISPSQSTKKIYSRYYPDLKIDVVPHPEIYNFETDPLQSRQDLPTGFDGDNVLNIGLLGGLSPKKGRKVLEKCLALSRKKNLPVRWILMGYTDLSDFCRQTDFIITGNYRKEDLPGLFSTYNIHIALLPAKWPETYSYTLSECFAVKCPVLVPDIGALAERVRQYGGGIILPSPITADAVIEQIESLIQQPDILNKLKKTMPQQINYDADQYFSRVYNSLTFTGPCNRKSADSSGYGQTLSRQKQIENMRICEQLIRLSANKRLTNDLRTSKIASRLTQNHADNLERHVVNLENIIKSEQERLRHEQNRLRHEQNRGIQTDLQKNALAEQLACLENEFQTLKQKMATFRGTAWSIKMVARNIIRSITGKKEETV